MGVPTSQGCSAYLVSKAWLALAYAIPVTFHDWWTCGFGPTGASSGVGTEGGRQLTLLSIVSAMAA